MPDAFKGRLVYKGLCGSRCQGLDLPTSDRDWKCLYAPIPEEVIGPSSTKHAKTFHREGEDFDVHDVRDLPQLLWKANPSYLEILCPEGLVETDADDYPRTVETVTAVYGASDSFARMNLPYLWDSTMGTYRYERKKFGKSIRGEVYDGKAACHALRMLKLLTMFHDLGFTDFPGCMYLPYDHRAGLLAIKKGEVPLEDVVGALDSAEKETVEHCEKAYKAADPDRELYDDLVETLGEALWEDLRELGYKGGRR